MGAYSTLEAINAGLDLEMPGPTQWRDQDFVTGGLKSKGVRAEN